MTDKQAISIIQSQIDKLKNSNENRNFSWTNETRAYIVEFFGKDSEQNSYFNDFNSWWKLIPSIDKDFPESIDNNEKNVIKFLEGCIDIIKNIGIVKKPKVNYLHTLPEWVITMVLPSLIVLGIMIGKYLNDVENLKLTNKIELLEIQIKKCQTKK